MERRELTCIVCPMGCRVTVEIEDGQMRIQGNQCKRGEEYCRQEVSAPVRVVTSLVAVDGGERPVCAVRTSGAIAKDKIPEVLNALRALRVSAPVRIGQVIAKDIAGSGADLLSSAGVAPLAS